MNTENEKLKVGTKVRHVNDHDIQGVVIGHAIKLNGKVCFVVETFVPDGLVGVFSPVLLEPIEH